MLQLYSQIINENTKSHPIRVIGIYVLVQIGVIRINSRKVVGKFKDRIYRT